MRSLISWVRRFVRVPNGSRPARPRRCRLKPCLEILEDRCLLSTYTVNNLQDTNSGVGNTGTLRYVINLANANHTGTAVDPDLIIFSTGAGTINVSTVDGGCYRPLPPTKSPSWTPRRRATTLERLSSRWTDLTQALAPTA